MSTERATISKREERRLRHLKRMQLSNPKNSLYVRRAPGVLHSGGASNILSPSFSKVKLRGEGAEIAARLFAAGYRFTLTDTVQQVVKHRGDEEAYGAPGEARYPGDDAPVGRFVSGLGGDFRRSGIVAHLTITTPDGYGKIFHLDVDGDLSARHVKRNRAIMVNFLPTVFMMLEEIAWDVSETCTIEQVIDEIINRP